MFESSLIIYYPPSPYLVRQEGALYVHVIFTPYYKFDIEAWFTAQLMSQTKLSA